MSGSTARQQAITSLFKRDLGFGDWEFRQNAPLHAHRDQLSQRLSCGLLRARLQHVEPIRGAGRRRAWTPFTIDNQIAGTLKTGAFTHTIIAGVDYQHTGQEEAAGFGGTVQPLNVFHPFYGTAVIDPAISFSARLNLQQTGVYAQDQIALGGFRLVLSGRNDWVDYAQYDRLARTTSSADPSKFTGRAGLLYLFDNGSLRPYVSYSTSFQPQTAVDKSGNVLAPTEGKQTEIGLKYQPKFWDTPAHRLPLRSSPDQCGDLRSHDGRGDLHRRGRGALARDRAGRLHAAPHGPRAEGQLHLPSTTWSPRTIRACWVLAPTGVPQATANAFGVYTFQNGALSGMGLGGGVRYLGQNFNGVAGGAAAGS